MTHFKLTTAAGTGLLITVSLLFLMTSLIGRGEASSPLEIRPLRALASTAPPPEPPAEPRLDAPTPPPPPQPVPSSARTINISLPPVPVVPAKPAFNSIRIDVGAVQSAPNPVGNASDHAPILVSAVAPVFPGPMLARKTEGYVDVQYDVDPTGRVINIRVVESSHRGFERAARNAAEKMRFRPRVVDGTPTLETDMMHRFRFELSD